MQYKFGIEAEKHKIQWIRWYDSPNIKIYLENSTKNLVVLTVEMEKVDESDKEIYALIKARLGTDEDKVHLENKNFYRY